MTQTSDAKIVQRKIFLRKSLMIAALFIVTGFLFPWWVMPAIAFIYGATLGAKETSALLVFGQAFAGIFVGWALVALAFDSRTSFHLSARLGGMFKLGFPVGGVIVASLVGGLLGALFALAGASLRIGAVRIINDRA